jgi:lambda repressor-like predicted transcriptional regulator
MYGYCINVKAASHKIMRSSQFHNGIGSSTVTNVLSVRYKGNDFIIKSGMEIDKNVKL